MPVAVHDEPSYSSQFVIAFGDGSIKPPIINAAVPVPAPLELLNILVVFMFGPFAKLVPSKVTDLLVPEFPDEPSLPTAPMTLVFANPQLAMLLAV